MSDRSTLHVRRLAPTDPEVAAAWRRLQAAGGVTSPFLAWEWVSALADVPEAAPGTEVLVVDDGDRILGLLPIQPLDGPGPLRAFGLAPRWLGADHLDVVAERPHRPTVARALMAYLASWPAWEMLDLDGLDASGTLAAQARGVLHLPRCFLLPPVGVPAPYVTLRGTDAWLRSSVMKNVTRNARLAERGGGGFSVVQHPDQVAELLEELIELHNRRLGKDSTVFATPPRRRFHLLAARRMAEAGMARIYRLIADGVNAGLQYHLVFAERTHFYQSGIVPSGRSPGITVLGLAIRSAAEEGLSEFDFLRGDELYKHRFATGTRRDLRLLAFRSRPRAVLYGGAWAGGKAGRRLSRRLHARMTSGQP